LTYSIEQIMEKIYESIIMEADAGHGYGHLSVTMLTFPCERYSVYSLIVPPEQRQLTLQGILRMWEGTKLHDTSFLRKENEVELHWNGISGRIDEYDPDEAYLIDKKVTRSIPRDGAREHHIKQIQYYSVLLERNGKPVKDASIVYINPDICRIKISPVELRPIPVVEKEMIEKKERIMNCVEHGILPPRNVVPWEEGGANVLCAYCPFVARCFREGKTFAKGKI